MPIAGRLALRQLVGLAGSGRELSADIYAAGDVANFLNPTAVEEVQVLSVLMHLVILSGRRGFES